MELATNTFNKGLQMDTHPMILGNDSLSDALNATFVTMNGNEVILQNDMGNRRVDNAFLPAGYQPVGMKEYGGIIYVAAYNSITNRSLIGSFPSPERKMGDEYTSLGGEWSTNVFIANTNLTTDEGLSFLIADTSLLKLTDDNSLHAGDKFSVYSSTICSRGDITNLNNTNGTKAISPKNKQYTLALGILNSQNEFVDITKTLHRWRGNNIIDEEGKSEIYKFNDGYFIANTDSSELWKYKNKDTKSDAELIKERKKKAINTYAYKLVGPLYLKTTLNHIELASYNIYGIWNGSKATLWIESSIVYNCPDGITYGTGSGSNDNYYTYDEGTPSFAGFNFYKLSPASLLPIDETKISKCSYNPTTNLYTVTVLKKYVNVEGSNGNILNYYFCVPAIGNINLRGLSEKGSIDLSLLGSGTVALTGWRFYNGDNEQTTLTYNFNAYPEYHLRFSDLSFKFTNVNNSSNVITLTESDGLTLNNGKTTISFDWRNKGFIERSLYTVTISYNIIDTETDSIVGSVSDKNINEWFLTTQLFNNCYRPSHEDYMNDFNGSKMLGEIDLYQKIRDKYLKISLDADVNFLNLSGEKEIQSYGKILSKQSELIQIDGVDYIYIKYKHTLPINLNISSSLKIKNEELYPSYLSLSGNNIQLKNTYNTNINDLINNIDYYSLSAPTISYLDSQDPDDDDKMIKLKNVSIGNNSVSGTLIYYDKFLAKPSKEDINIKEGFTSVSDAINKLVELAHEKKTYSGIYLNIREQTGHGDWHNISTTIDNPTEFEDRTLHDYINPPNGIIIEEDGKDEQIRYLVRKNYSKIVNEFDKSNKCNPFIWLGVNFPLSGKHEHDWQSFARKTDTFESYNDPVSRAKSTSPFARIWWKTKNPQYSWALLELFATSSSNVESTIKNHFISGGSNIYICFYKETVLNDFYLPSEDKNHNYEYKFTLDLILDSTCSATLNGNKNNYPIKFTIENSVNVPLTSEDIKIESSESFLDIISRTDNIPTERINIETGYNLDTNGNELSVNLVYKKNSKGELEIVENSKITPHSIDWGGLYYGFLYGNSSTLTIGTPDNLSNSYRYDVCNDGYDSDSDTNLDYAGINMVKRNSIDG